MAAPTWVAAGTKASRANQSGTTSTVDPPAGNASGDLLVIAVDTYRDAGNTTVSTPSGWTLLSSTLNWNATVGSRHSSYLFWKLAGGSESAVTLTTSANAYLDAQMFAFRGVDASTPIDATAVWSAESAAGTVAVSAITTVTNDALMVVAGFECGSANWTTPPAGATERSESASFIVKFIVATEMKATAGTEAADSYARDSTVNRGRTAVFAIRPTASASAPIADFTATPLTGSAPLSVTFTDTSTNTPTSWAWDFGDGGTSTSQNPSHSYTTSGTFTVSLTATNTAGSDGEVKTGYVTVSEPITYVPPYWVAGGQLDIW